MPDLYDDDYRGEDLSDPWADEIRGKNEQQQSFIPAFPLEPKAPTLRPETPCLFKGTSDKRCGFCIDCRDSYL